MAHQSIIAALSLNDGRCFKIELVPSMNDRVKSRYLVVEACQVYVSTCATVAVRIEGIGLAIFEVRKHAKVLRPVSEWSYCIDECVWSGDGV